MDWQLMTTLLSALVLVVFTAVCTHYSTRRLLKTPDAAHIENLTTTLQQTRDKCTNLTTESNALRNRLSDLEAQLRQAHLAANKYTALRERLQRSTLISSFEQPVLVVGPRGVGKTSLMFQWHAPWERSPLEEALSCGTVTVPVYDCPSPEEDLESPFLDKDILVRRRIRLLLKVHDFTGELRIQPLVRQMAVKETQALRSRTRKDLGIVLICMFDAQEAFFGPSDVTKAYYNGDLFRELRTMVTHDSVRIDRLILVFNKYDLLRKRIGPEKDDTDLLRYCRECFQPCLSLLQGICNPEKVCEVFTTLSQDDMPFNNRGAPTVLVEAARNFVRAVAGHVTRADIIKYAADSFDREKAACGSPDGTQDGMELQ